MEVVVLAREDHSVGRYGLMRMVAEVLIGFQKSERHGFALIGLLAVFLLILLLGLAGSQWISGMHMPSWLSWLR